MLETLVIIESTIIIMLLITIGILLFKIVNTINECKRAIEEFRSSLTVGAVAKKSFRVVTGTFRRIGNVKIFEKPKKLKNKIKKAI